MGKLEWPLYQTITKNFYSSLAGVLGQDSSGEAQVGSYQGQY